ncbi:MAG TPA: alpha/beta hydrolase, partial [Polyangiaceae bacterium]|nr:alpha/beta hydrolase [Polyangiaceae bacterium]
MQDRGRFARARGAIERTGFRVIIGNELLRSRLAKSRSTPVDGRTLHPEFGAMLALDDVTHRSDLTPLDPVMARARIVTDVATVTFPGPALDCRDLVIDSPALPIPARLYTPNGLAARSPAVVYFHGGGWVTCSVATHDAFCRRLAAEARCRVVSIDYRLAPEHRFPAAVEDAIAATRFVLANAHDLGVDPERVAVAGDSAGGNLSAVVALATRNDARRPRLQALIYPALDMTCRTASHVTFAERYFLTRAMVDWFLGHYVG